MTTDYRSSTPLAHSVKDAAIRIGISRSRCYELVKTGEIRGIEIGKCIVIPEAELQRVITEASREAA